MKNLTSFCVCVAIGIAVVVLPRFVDGAIESRVSAIPDQVSPAAALRPDAGVTLRIAEFTKFDDDFSILVSATNDDVATFKYFTYATGNESIPQMGFPELTLDGEPQMFGWCGTGAVERELVPGATVFFRLSPFFARKLYAPGREVRVGYFFAASDAARATMFVTEPVEFTPEQIEFIKQSIEKSK